MSFYPFTSGAIVHTSVVTNPPATVILQGNAVTGSVYLEKQFGVEALANRQIQGFSERLGGLTTKFARITASIDIVSGVQGGTNASTYAAVQNLYAYYSLSNYVFTAPPAVRIITVPAIYYDRRIQSASFSASDLDASGTLRQLYDNGRGGVYSGSLTASLVGSIFYDEGLVVLTSSGLQDFGAASPQNFKWRCDFAGTHTIPCNIYRCRAPAGELNATTNRTFHTVPVSGSDKGFRVLLTSSIYPYISAVGLYDSDFELVAVGRLAQPIKKDAASDIAINLKMDY